MLYKKSKIVLIEVTKIKFKRNPKDDKTSPYCGSWCGLCNTIHIAQLVFACARINKSLSHFKYYV